MKVTRSEAKKIWNKGGSIIVVPSKTRLESDLVQVMSKDDTDEPDFDLNIEHYEYLNCDKNTGLKAVFYTHEN